ncbi:DgyrCDS11051 [Dimorphilus gyrociliatus]|uniref:DgyrCDS11051 n=1 Tax=Dimorphilus gyrociliatus TaxID=2664684 RepID=A0A7I8W435_9ANNE|nr:DgyrCDS11051 [Dimorphilus gyrociliatus]
MFALGLLYTHFEVSLVKQKQTTAMHTIERRRQHNKHLQKYNQMRNSYTSPPIPPTSPPIFSEDPSTVSTSDGYAYVNDAFAKDGTITIINDEKRASAKSIPPGQKFIVIENGQKKALRNYTIE